MPQTPDKNRAQLWQGITSKKLYSKTLQEFETQFGDVNNQQKLHEQMVAKKLYSKPFEEFQSQFFGDLGKKKVDTEPSGMASLAPLGPVGAGSQPQSDVRLVPNLEGPLGAPQPDNKERNPLTSYWKSMWSVARYDLPSAAVGLSAAVTSPSSRGMNTLGFSPGDLRQSIQENRPETEVAKENATRQKLKSLYLAQDLRNQSAEYKQDLVNTLDKIEDPLDFLNWTFSALGQSSGQIPMTIATGGGSSLVQEIGSIYLDGVNKIAEEEGITPEQVITQGKDNSLDPLIYGVSAALLDRVGAGAVKNVFTKGELMKSIRERAMSIIKAGGKEALTEATQTGLEQIGVSQMADKSLSETLSELDFKEIGEAAAQGLVGGAGISGVASAASGFKQTQDAPQQQQEAVTDQPQPLTIDATKEVTEEPVQPDGSAEPVVAAQEPRAQDVPDIRQDDSQADGDQVSGQEDQDLTTRAILDEDGNIVFEEEPDGVIGDESPAPTTDQAEQTTTTDDIPGPVPAEEQRETSYQPGTEKDTGETAKPEPSRDAGNTAASKSIGKTVSFKPPYSTVYRPGEVIGVDEKGRYRIKERDGTIHRIERNETRPISTATSGIFKVPNIPGMNISLDISPKFMDKFKSKFYDLFRSRGNLNRGAFDVINKGQAWIAGEQTRTKYIVQKMRNALKSDFKKPSTSDMELVNSVLSGERDASVLPQATREAVAEMRDHIRMLQKEMVNEGVVSGDLALRVDEDGNTYLNRSYRIHDDPEGWVEYVNETPEGQQIRNRAYSFLRSMYPQDTEAELNGKIDELLHKNDGPLAVLQTSRPGSKDLGILKKRQDIPAEIRALLGEYDDPIVNYGKSVVKMAALIGNHKIQKDLIADGLGVYLFPDNPTGKYFTKLVEEKSKKNMDLLANMYTSKEFADAFNSLRETPSYSPVAKWYLRILGSFKYGKTILSSSTHVRNLIGSGIIAVANGHVIGGIGKGRFFSAAKDAINGLKFLDDAAFREKMIEYTRLGVLGESHQAGFMQDLLKDAGRDMSPQNQFEKPQFIRKSADFIQRMYQAEDDVYKIMAFENEYARYRDAFDSSMTDQQVREYAAGIVRKTFPTYSLAPKIINILRKSPLLASFPTFTAEMMRTGFNTVHLTAQELRSSNPKIRAIGRERLLGILSAMALTYGLKALSMSLYGVESDEDEALDDIVAPWARGGQRIYTKEAENGVYSYVDLGYSDPYSVFKRPLQLLLNESFEDDAKWVEAATESALTVLDPFISAEMTTKLVMEIYNNQDEYGRPVYNQELIRENPGDVLAQIYQHLAVAAEPGMIRASGRLVGAIRGETSDYGKQYKVGDELLFILGGQRKETLNVAKSTYYRFRNLKEGMADSERIFKSPRQRGVDRLKLAEEFEKARSAKKYNLDQARKLYKNAIELGAPVSELSKALRDSGMSGAEIRYVMDKTDTIVVGGITNYSPSSSSGARRNTAL